MIYIGLILLLIIGISTASFSNLFFKFSIKSYKYSSIEGLRGFLAFFVFIHHYGCWYHFLHTGEWRSFENISLLRHFGGTSVRFFFLITGFLFFDKLIRNKIENWSEFLIKRILRLLPMYFISITVLILLVLVKTNFHLLVSGSKFIEDSINWLAFAFVKTPMLNNDVMGWVINAAVQWTISYEILFYLFLPILAAVFFQKKIPFWIAIFSTYLIYFYLSKKGFDVSLLQIFLYGWVIAWINFKTPDSKIYSSFLFSILVIALFYIIVQNYIVDPNLWIVALSVCFFIIVKGNSIVGILNWNVSQLLGQISYSVYLIHGIIIYCMNTYFISNSWIQDLSSDYYFALGSFYAFFVIVISFFTYRFIEIPFLNLSSKIPNFINNLTQFKQAFMHKIADLRA